MVCVRFGHGANQPQVNFTQGSLCEIDLRCWLMVHYYIITRRGVSSLARRGMALGKGDGIADAHGPGKD